jgi:hypothetical protein
VEEDFGTMRKAAGANSNGNREGSLNEDDRKIMDALAKIWVSFAKYAQPKQAITELPEYGRWVRMEAGHRSLNYYHISNLSLQKGMRSDYRKAVREINQCKNFNIFSPSFNETFFLNLGMSVLDGNRTPSQKTIEGHPRAGTFPLSILEFRHCSGFVCSNYYNTDCTYNLC